MEKIELKTLILNIQEGIPLWRFQNVVRIKSISWSLMGAPMSSFLGLKLIFPEFQTSMTGDISDSTFIIMYTDGVCSSGNADVSIVCNQFEVSVDTAQCSGGIIITYEDVVG